MKNLFTSILVLSSLLAYSQNYETYGLTVAEADSLMAKKKYKKAAQKYEDAMVHLDGKAYMTDRMNLARSYAQSGKPDTAFYHLGRVIDGFKYTELDKIKGDSLLTVLQKHKKWSTMENNLLAMKADIEKDYDWEIINQLAEIEKKDQEGRNQTAIVEVKYGRDSDELEKLWNEINTQDSLNMLVVGKILDERGWLGPQIIGEEGSTTLFLVIQHANLEDQLKYLPMMREAVEKKYADGGSLAMLEDRVALRQGEKQIYGSQIGRFEDTGEFYVLPLTKPETVDERRAKVGLAPLGVYTRFWNFDWSVEQQRIDEERHNGVK